MEKKGQLGGLAIGITTLIIAAFVLVMGIIVMGSVYETVETTATSEETVLSDFNKESTLDQIVESSMSATAKNQTWLDFNATVNSNVSNLNSFAGNTNMTFSVWFKLDHDSAEDTEADTMIRSGYYYLHSRNNSGFPANDDQCNNIVLRYSDGVGARGSSALCGSTLSKAQINFGDRDWHFAVATYYQGDHDAEGIDFANFTSMFIDGVRVDSDSHAGIPSAGLLSSTYIGTYDGNPVFNGSLDDVRIYNDSLSAKAIANLYHNSSIIGYTDKLIPVILLHQFVNNSVASTSTQINDSQLYELMNYINDSGMECITDIDYYNWTQGLVDLPNKPVIITWDDQYVLQWVNASKIMDEYECEAVASLTTITMTASLWGNLSLLVNDSNWSVASHSQTHCYMGNASGATSPVWCNSTADRQGNLSEAKADIIDNLGITPITHFFPWSDWGNNDGSSSYDYLLYPEVMDDCQRNYTLCFGDGDRNAGGGERIGWIEYLTINSSDNLSMRNGSLKRIGFYNYSTIEDLEDYFNDSKGLDKAQIIYKFNENSGTTAYDNSGQGNNGTITGATWQDDGVDNTLTDLIDYTVLGNVFTIANSEYAWSGLTLNHEKHSDASQRMSETSLGIATFSDFWEVIILALVISIVIGLLIGVFGSGRGR